mmetsp:Transcript_46697/g.117539  ORF Transcript_46697/g.117539 Transcript_46697/m.117539 type:complete len:271 (+) Transcript_46697:122-934(+)
MDPVSILPRLTLLACNISRSHIVELEVVLGGASGQKHDDVFVLDLLCLWDVHLLDGVRRELFLGRSQPAELAEHAPALFLFAVPFCLALDHLLHEAPRRKGRLPPLGALAPLHRHPLKQRRLRDRPAMLFAHRRHEEAWPSADLGMLHALSCMPHVEAVLPDTLTMLHGLEVAILRAGLVRPPAELFHPVVGAAKVCLPRLLLQPLPIDVRLEPDALAVSELGNYVQALVETFEQVDDLDTGEKDPSTYHTSADSGEQPQQVPCHASNRI